MVALSAGIAAALLFVVFFRGYTQLRADPLGHLSEADRDLIKAPVKKRQRASLLTKFGQWLGPSISGLMGRSYYDFISRRVMYARSDQFADASDFFAMKARLLLIFGVGALAVGSIADNYLAAFLIAVIGFFLPDLVLRSAGQRRQAMIEEGLPDFLDVLSVTVSAGLSFRGALDRVIERTEGPLAEEMETTLQQMDVGTSRYDAFHALKERTDSQAMEAFVTSLMQAEDLGSPLVESLEQISTDVRQSRAQKARQVAAKASPKIASVVTLIMVPGTLVLMLASMFLVADFDFDLLFGDGGF
ncbi:type II secretion system F family protein [Nesterenkonia massiliensis]|uniref:Type II secretion system F family protein n=1 Tax=Nesterenkonia massiliensis TaxID=1232429 RepID=A0ABT2HRD6_9MICC|nr:type II secretion system F family protein [Nesterenkonia massiliensis]MCT1607244.1 type II secretion system F family protein [Nesterenkonia massiliensis]